MEILILLLLYPLFMERKWQKECYKERGEKKCGGVCGGDNTTGAATVILACGAGVRAAKEIDEYLGGKNEK